MSISRGAMRTFLSEHHGDARPDTLPHLSGHDLDAVAAEFGRPVPQQPWGRELELRDPVAKGLRIAPVPR